MANLVTYEAYVRVTGDSSSAASAVAEALADAQALVEEELERPLELLERTEILDLIGGRVYPRATPITEAPWTIDGYALTNIDSDWITEPFDSATTQVSVTYTGGYTDETLPRRLRDAIIEMAYSSLNRPSVSVAYVGAESIRQGDISISYGSKGAGAYIDAIPVSVAKKIRPYRWMVP
jgi:hypothetical protein